MNDVKGLKDEEPVLIHRVETEILKRRKQPINKFTN
jgi:hypothetical protein